MTYLDWNATTPPLPAVIEAMRAAMESAWANPSSVHGHGRSARARIEDARAAVGKLAGVDPRDVIFTSGGTEANNLAIRSATGPIVTSRLEHPSVTRAAETMPDVRWVKVLSTGVLDLEDLARVIEGAGLVTVQAVNHETGIVQPVLEVIELAKKAGAKVHVDAVQGFGKVDVPAGWDTAAMGPHKMRGPKGIGALACKQGTRIDPVLRGGSQEKGVRPGTIDASLAAGFEVAAKEALTGPARWARIAPLRDRLEAALTALGGRPVGDRSRRAPHVANLIWSKWIGAELVAALDLEGVCVSSGSACSAGTVEPSPVLLAMFGPEDAVRGVRLSLGDTTSERDIDHTIDAFTRVIQR